MSALLSAVTVPTNQSSVDAAQTLLFMQPTPFGLEVPWDLFPLYSVIDSCLHFGVFYFS